MNRHPQPPASAARTLVERLVFLAIAGLFVHTWLLQGIIHPFRIVSGSMAEGLLGLHREVVCADCGFSFRCGSEKAECRPAAVCPNCGFFGTPLADVAELPGDGVTICPTAFQFRPPRRWEAVAFRSPRDAEQVLVKRVVGLPGEEIQIRDGDLYIDGAIQRKTLDQQRAMAILVHHAAFAPKVSHLPPRWQTNSAASRWHADDGRFAHPAEDAADTPDWIEYRHWTRKAGRPAEVEETPISDDLAYNQNFSRRDEETRAVGDVMLAFRLDAISGAGALLLRATDGREQFAIELDPTAHRWSAWSNDAPVPTGSNAQGCGPLPPLAGAEVVLSLFDRQLLLAVNNQTLLCWPYEPTHRPHTATSRPLAIGVKGLAVALSDLRVYRDVYYTRPVGLDARWALDRPCRLGPDEFFVLGDNSAVSDDSRTWPEGPTVEYKSLYGKPLAVIAPGGRAPKWGWGFQVPDPCRIRYIR